MQTRTHAITDAAADTMVNNITIARHLCLLARMNSTDGAIENEAHDRLVGQRAAFHASQSLFTLRHTRLTVSLPTAPPNRAESARRPQRVEGGGHSPKLRASGQASA
jgi:hypothetical protein